MAKKNRAKRVARGALSDKKVKKLVRSLDKVEDSMEALEIAEKDLANVRENLQQFLERAEKILSGAPTIKKGP